MSYDPYILAMRSDRNGDFNINLPETQEIHERCFNAVTPDVAAIKAKV